MKRLLIVDDDPAWLALYRMAFECQFEIVEAADPHHALAVLGDVKPDVILLDLRMPRMHGFEFIRRLDHRGLRIPVVVCSGAVVDGECPAMPGVRSAQKTSDLRELRAALRAAVPPGPEGAAISGPANALDQTYWRD
jgi:CheY-like chemotaxis protein